MYEFVLFVLMPGNDISMKSNAYQKRNKGTDKRHEQRDEHMIDRQKEWLIIV